MLGNNLKYYRLRANLSQRELAGQTNLSAMTISYYEAGSRGSSADILKRLAQWLGTTVSKLMASYTAYMEFDKLEFAEVLGT